MPRIRTPPNLPGKALLDSFFATHDVPYETRRAAARVIRRGFQAYRSGIEDRLDIPIGENVIKDKTVNKSREQRKLAYAASCAFCGIDDSISDPILDWVAPTRITEKRAGR